MHLSECSLDPLGFEKEIFNCPKGIRQIGLDSPLHNRFVCWRVFLNVFPEEGKATEWVAICEELREKYRELQNSFEVRGI